MTEINIAFHELTGHTLMSEPTEKWNNAEAMLAEGIDAETIALTLAE